MVRATYLGRLMIPPSEWDISEKVLGGTCLTAIAAFVVQKMMTSWRSDSSNRAGAAATEAQFVSLRNQIKAQDERIAVQDSKISMLLVEMQRQDVVIHKQQTKVTRMEVLLRQFVGLMQEHSITVPGYMQTELDELVKVDRDPNAKTRESDK